MPALLSHFVMTLLAVESSTTLFVDEFENDAIATRWEVAGFVLSENGSFADLGELSLSQADGELRIAGTSEIDVATVDGENAGWIGRALATTEGLHDYFAVETSVRIVSYESGPGTGDHGFQAGLFIEFDRDNRVVLTVGDSKNGPRRVQAFFDEHDARRTALSEYAFAEGPWIRVRLEFERFGLENRVRGIVDGVERVSDLFIGSLAATPRVGLCAVVRGPGDTVDARFDRFSVLRLARESAGRVYLALESFPPATLESVNTVVRMPDLQDQFELARQSALFALSSGGWEIQELVDAGAALGSTNGLDVQGPPRWTGPFIQVRFTVPGNSHELLERFGYALNDEALTYGSQYSLHFHTDDWVERLDHDIGESPENFGTISGGTSGVWHQTPVPSWGRFTAVPAFRRGDVNGDNAIDISDSIFTLLQLFLTQGSISCPDAADTNDDGSVNMADAIFSLTYIFLNGEPPAAPGVQSCGPDATEDDLPLCRYVADGC